MRTWPLPVLVAAGVTASLALIAPRSRHTTPLPIAEPPPTVVRPVEPPHVEESKPAPAPGSGSRPVAVNEGSVEIPKPVPSRKRKGKYRCLTPSIVEDTDAYFRRFGRCPPDNTPLVLSFDGAPVAYDIDRAHGFDLSDAASLVTDWPTARTPWLALDRDGDGRIADGSELFGSMTLLSTGERAPNGFAALGELDGDGDGRITPSDPAFARLLVWVDLDGDRRSSPGELVSAAAMGIVSIDLDFIADPHCDERGNCEVERASFRWRDADAVERTGAVIDVHLAAQH